VKLPNVKGVIFQVGGPKVFQKVFQTSVSIEIEVETEDEVAPEPEVCVFPFKSYQGGCVEPCPSNTHYNVRHERLILII